MDSAFRDAILEAIIRFYFESGDFNGMPVRIVKARFGLSDAEANDLLRSLVSEGVVDVMCGNVHPNPHIKAFSGIPRDDQLRFLAELKDSDHFCLYPTRTVLDKRPEPQKFDGAPYSKELALGAGQLDFRAFDLSVLEYYRNDPRYSYRTDWISGSISIRDEYFESDAMPEHDQVLLQTFGFAYDEDLNRAVAVFVRYLHDLSPEHQRVWAAKELGHGYKLHPDYYRNSILGDWGRKISVFDAFLQELVVIDEMAATMGRPPLFRETFKDNPPKEFGFLLRPTIEEFNAFVQLLDKMMSDNLNYDFFQGEVPREEHELRSDGKVVVRQLGTIQLLDRWIHEYFKPADPTPIEKMLEVFRKVRKLRQKPAHAVAEDEFDQKYFREQRQLVLDAYEAVRTLRLILANHPRVRAKPPEIGKHLYEGEIWDI